MKKTILLILSIFLSTNIYANNDCHEGLGLWVGKFSYKDLSLCQLKYPELCQNVGVAIGIRYSGQDNIYLADLYPQRGRGATIPLACENGKLSFIDLDIKDAKFDYSCDNVNNCVVSYEDYRLKGQLIKLWQENGRMNLAG